MGADPPRPPTGQPGRARSSSWSWQLLLTASKDVEPCSNREVVGLPGSGVGQPAGGLVGVGRSRDRHRAPVAEESAEDYAAGAAELDEGELRHVTVGGWPFDDEGGAGAVQNDRRLGLPRVDERLVLPRHVARPSADEVVGIPLDDRAERPQVRRAVEELGAATVRSWAPGYQCPR